jgi:hypothetical protein
MRLQREWGFSLDFVQIKKFGFSVPYELRESPGCGLGIFAADFIAAGTEMWRAHVGQNLIIYDGEAGFLSHLSSLGDEAGPLGNSWRLVTSPGAPTFSTFWMTAGS